MNTFLLGLCFSGILGKPTWPFEFLKRRLRRANSWHHAEEIFEGSFEGECIEESCDFNEMHEIDDDLTIGQAKWAFYQKCHDRYL